MQVQGDSANIHRPISLALHWMLMRKKYYRKYSEENPL